MTDEQLEAFDARLREAVVAFASSATPGRSPADVTRSVSASPRVRATVQRGPGLRPRSPVGVGLSLAVLAIVGAIVVLNLAKAPSITGSTASPTSVSTPTAAPSPTASPTAFVSAPASPGPPTSLSSSPSPSPNDALSVTGGAFVRSFHGSGW